MHLPNFMAIAAMSSRLESLGKFTEEFLRTKRFWFDHFDPSPCFFQVGYHMLQLLWMEEILHHLGWFKHSNPINNMK
jgi:hypothetical protein